MSTVDTPLPNRQARTTVGILNTVRTIGTIGFAGLVGLILLGSLVGAFTADQGAFIFITGLVMAGMTAIFGALFYAVVGWYADSLSLLTQIAKNTAA